MRAFQHSPLAIIFDDELWAALNYQEQTMVLQWLDQRVITYKAAELKAAERRELLAIDNLSNN